MGRKNLILRVAAIAIFAGLSATVAQAKVVRSHHANGSPIVLFGDEWLTGLQPNPSYVVGMQAAVDAINKAGGINGSQLSLDICDNQGDPNASTACLQQGISDKAVAFVALNDHTCGTVQPTLQQQHIADVFPFPACPEYFSNPDSYPMEGGTFTQFVGRAAVYKKLGITKLGIASNNSSAALLSVQLARLSASAGLVKFTGDVQMTPTTTDFSSQVLTLRTQGAQGVVMVGSFSQEVGIVKAATSIGWSPTWFVTANSTTEAQYDQLVPLTSGKIMVSSSLPSPRTSSPGMNLFNAEVTASGQAADDYTNRTQGAITGWLAVHAAANVIKTIKGPVTNLTFLAALKKVKTMNLYGLETWKPNTKGPSAYPRVTSARCWELTGDSNGFLVSAPGLPQGVDVMKLLHFVQ